MRLSPSEISAAVFCSAIASSQSRPQDNPGIEWHRDNDFVRIYRTEVPWTPIDYQGDHRHDGNFAFVAWVAVLSVAISAACLVLLFCVCWRLCTSRSSLGQSSNSNQMEHRTSTAFHTGPDGVFTPSGNIYGSGMVNFSFTNSLQDPMPVQCTEDKPPDYSSVVAELSQNDKPSVQPLNSTVTEAKPPLETPPPAYVSVTAAPFSSPPK